MKALIFGANGQDGYYLSAACRKRGFEVVGISRNGPWRHGNVASAALVRELVQTQRPDIVFHLAASSTTAHHALYENHDAIGTGTINILESVRQWSPKTKVFIAGSGLQFVNTGTPVSETDPFDHSSAYVAARNYAVYLSRYFRTLGLRTYVGYLFHHESPRRGPQHVSQKIAQAVRRIATGSEEKISLGDISVLKEWTYAEDVAEGIMTFIGQNEVSEAAIGSGRAHSIEEWLYECFRLVNKDWREYVEAPKDYRAEYKLLVSNPATINSLGWRATTSLADLAKIMVNQ